MPVKLTHKKSTNISAVRSPLPIRRDGRHATKVRGLEAYGIDPAVFGKQVKKRFACSTAAQPAPVSFVLYFLGARTVSLPSRELLSCVRDQRQLGSRCARVVSGERRSGCVHCCW